MKKGFTLLELLIVIGILAILATAATLVLNPAELLKQARDTQRIADLNALKAAIALHLTTGTTPDTNVGGSGAAARCMVGTTSPFTAACSNNTVRLVNGTGWVNVNIADVSGGAPLSVLPQDPTNSATYFYAYAGEDVNLTFEINARLESQKYRDKMINDGGSANTCTTFQENTCWYETGTSLTL